MTREFRPKRWLVATVSAAALWLLTSAAWAADRIAVVISADDAADAALAENLAEVAIAKLAENRAGELVGSRELNRLLHRAGDGQDIAACVKEPACLAQLREEHAIALVVEGTLQRKGARLALELQLLNASTGKQQRRFSRTSEDTVADLVQATREGVGELFAPTVEAIVPEAPASVRILTVPPQSLARVRSEPAVAPPPGPPPTTGSWRSTAGYTSAALTVLSLSAAAVLGTLAAQEPGGRTRHEAQTNLERERAFATTANVLWISSGVFAAISVFAFMPSPRSEPAK